MRSGIAAIREQFDAQLRSDHRERLIMAKRIALTEKAEAEQQKLRTAVVSTLLSDYKHIDTSFVAPLPKAELQTDLVQSDDDIVIDLGKRVSQLSSKSKQKPDVRDLADGMIDPEDDVMFLDEEDPLYAHVGNRPIRMSDHALLTQQYVTQSEVFTKLKQEADVLLSQAVFFLRQPKSDDLTRMSIQRALLKINGLITSDDKGDCDVPVKWVKFMCDKTEFEGHDQYESRIDIVFSCLIKHDLPDIQLSALSIMVSLASSKYSESIYHINRSEILHNTFQIIQTSSIVENLDCAFWILSNLVISNPHACSHLLKLDILDKVLSLYSSLSSPHISTASLQTLRDACKSSSPQNARPFSLELPLSSDLQQSATPCSTWPVFQQPQLTCPSISPLARLSSRLVEFSCLLFKELSQCRKIRQEHKLMHVRQTEEALEENQSLRVAVWLLAVAQTTFQAMGSFNGRATIEEKELRGLLEEILVAFRLYFESCRTAEDLGSMVRQLVDSCRHAGIAVFLDDLVWSIIVYDRAASSKPTTLRLEACNVLGCLSSVDEVTIHSLNMRTTKDHLQRGLFSVFAEDLYGYNLAVKPKIASEASELHALMVQEEVFIVSNLLQTSGDQAFQVFESSTGLFTQIGETLFRSNHHRSSDRALASLCLRVLTNLLKSIEAEDYKEPTTSDTPSNRLRAGSGVLTAGERLQVIMNSLSDLLQWILQSLDETLDEGFTMQLLKLFELILKIDRYHEAYYGTELGYTRECLAFQSLQNLESMSVHRSAKVRSLATDILETYYENVEEDLYT